MWKRNHTFLDLNIKILSKLQVLNIDMGVFMSFEHVYDIEVVIFLFYSGKNLYNKNKSFLHLENLLTVLITLCYKNHYYKQSHSKNSLRLTSVHSSLSQRQKWLLVTRIYCIQRHFYDIQNPMHSIIFTKVTIAIGSFEHEFMICVEHTWEINSNPSISCRSQKLIEHKREHQSLFRQLFGKS